MTTGKTIALTRLGEYVQKPEILFDLLISLQFHFIMKHGKMHLYISILSFISNNFKQVVIAYKGCFILINLLRKEKTAIIVTSFSLRKRIGVTSYRREKKGAFREGLIFEEESLCIPFEN